MRDSKFCERVRENNNVCIPVPSDKNGDDKRQTVIGEGYCFVPEVTEESRVMVFLKKKKLQQRGCKFHGEGSIVLKKSCSL